MRKRTAIFRARRIILLPILCIAGIWGCAVYGIHEQTIVGVGAGADAVYHPPLYVAPGYLNRWGEKLADPGYCYGKNSGEILKCLDADKSIKAFVRHNVNADFLHELEVDTLIASGAAASNLSDGNRKLLLPSPP